VILVDDLAEIVERVDTPVVRSREPRRPVTVERIERMLQAQAAQRSVAVVRVRGIEPRPRAEHVRVLVLEKVRVAIDARLVRQGQRGAAAEHVELFDLESVRVRSAVPAERDAGIQRPDVARRDCYVDATVVIPDRAHGRVVQIARRAQDALGFLQQASRVEIAAVEQQLLAHDALARSDVKLVRGPEQDFVFLRVVQIEDVLRVDVDLADGGAGTLELFVRWNRGRSGCLGRCRAGVVAFGGRRCGR
jgi:hypothetical protein